MISNAKYFESIKYFLEQNGESKKKFLFFVASKTKIDLEELNVSNIQFEGAVFPSIIYNDRLYDKGMIVLELNDFFQSLFIKSINEVSFCENEFLNTQSIICIVEGISKNNETFLDKLFATVDINTSIIGGGAGFMENNTGVIFNNEGFYNNSALLIKVKKDINMNAQHGCEYLAGPYVATSCENNVLKQIDYKDALEVYKKIIRDKSSIVLTPENFSEVAKNYPIGIVKYESEQIVRDPIALKGGELVLVGEIKNNAVINILKVNSKTMLASSKKAAQQSITDDSNLVFMFDCASRVAYLKEHFTQEMNNISTLTKNKTVIGAVTMGEIANCGNRYIHFYNKTCVIGSTCI